jgi:hypothetical protein
MVYCMADATNGIDRRRLRLLLGVVNLLVVTALFIHCSATDEGMTVEVGTMGVHASSSSAHGVAGMCGVALAAIGLFFVAAATSLEPRQSSRRRDDVWIVRHSMRRWQFGRLRLIRLCVMRL